MVLMQPFTSKSGQGTAMVEKTQNCEEEKPFLTRRIHSLCHYTNICTNKMDTAGTALSGVATEGHLKSGAHI